MTPHSGVALPTLFPALSRRAFLSLSLRSMAACAVEYLTAPFRRAFAGTSPSLKFFRRIVAQDNRAAAMIEWQCDALLDGPRFFLAGRRRVQGNRGRR